MIKENDKLYWHERIIYIYIDHITKIYYFIQDINWWNEYIYTYGYSFNKIMGTSTFQNYFYIYIYININIYINFVYYIYKSLSNIYIFKNNKLTKPIKK